MAAATVPRPAPERRDERRRSSGPQQARHVLDGQRMHAVIHQLLGETQIVILCSCQRASGAALSSQNSLLNRALAQSLTAAKPKPLLLIMNPMPDPATAVAVVLPRSADRLPCISSITNGRPHAR